MFILKNVHKFVPHGTFMNVFLQKGFIFLSKYDIIIKVT